MYDLAGLEQVMTKRPLPVPAVLLMLCSTLSYLSESVVPAAVMCALTVFAGLCHMRIKKNADAVFPVIMISLILLNSGFYISSRLNAREDLDNTEFRCRVTSVSREMSGDTDVVVRLDGGAYSVLKYYGNDNRFAAIKSGDILRLQGKGLPQVNSRIVGDLIVNVNVWTPKSLTREEKAMLEQLSTHENFVPKPGKNDKSVFNRVRQFFQ